MPLHHGVGRVGSFARVERHPHFGFIGANGRTEDVPAILRYGLRFLYPAYFDAVHRLNALDVVAQTFEGKPRAVAALYIVVLDLVEVRQAKRVDFSVQQCQYRIVDRVLELTSAQDDHWLDSAQQYQRAGNLYRFAATTTAIRPAPADRAYRCVVQRPEHPVATE